jgi:predicted phosphate transport protein (TIGR00153 family)
VHPSIVHVHTREVIAMRLLLRPRDRSFGDYFTKAAENLARGTELLAELNLPDADICSISERLVKIEHDSDALTHDLYNRINSTFVTPFDRADIWQLGACLDDVMDHLEAVGSLLYLYGLTVLPPLPQEMHELVGILDQQARLTLAALPRLTSLKDLKPYWVQCDRLENEGDRVYRALLVRLFSGEFDALTVLKLKEVADELESACDAFEHVANCVQTIAVKES